MQPENAPAPIDFTLAGIVIDVNAVQSTKALSFIVIMLFGIINDEPKYLQNANLSIVEISGSFDQIISAAQF